MAYADGRPKAALQRFGGIGGANWRFATWACSSETMTTADRWASFLFLGTVVSGGCAYYSPQALVATNILATDKDAFSHSTIRVEGQVCGNRLLSIPFGPDPTMDSFMDALQAKATGAIGFEDIRIDRVFVNYLFIFSKDCVHGSALPLLPRTKEQPEQPPERRQRAAPRTHQEKPVSPEPPASDAGTKPDQSADPWAH